MQKLLNVFPLPNAPNVINGGALNPSGQWYNYSITHPQERPGWQGSLRLDYNISDKWQRLRPRQQLRDAQQGPQQRGQPLSRGIRTRTSTTCSAAKNWGGTVTWIGSPTLRRRVHRRLRAPGPKSSTTPKTGWRGSRRARSASTCRSSSRPRTRSTSSRRWTSAPRTSAPTRPPSAGKVASRWRTSPTPGPPPPTSPRSGAATSSRADRVRRSLDDAALARVFFSHPLLTLKVIAAIHWEALRLLAEGRSPAAVAGRARRRPDPRPGPPTHDRTEPIRRLRPDRRPGATAPRPPRCSARRWAGPGGACWRGCCARCAAARSRSCCRTAAASTAAAPRRGRTRASSCTAGARWRALALAGDIGLAESYRDGDWSTPDLVALLEFGIRNEAGWGGTLDAAVPMRWLLRALHLARANTRRGSRQNIAFHYDLGNAFYARWLDPALIYSSALYGDPAQSLEAAQAGQARPRRAAASARRRCRRRRRARDRLRLGRAGARPRATARRARHRPDAVRRAARACAGAGRGRRRLGARRPAPAGLPRRRRRVRPHRLDRDAGGGRRALLARLLRDPARSPAAGRRRGDPGDHDRRCALRQATGAAPTSSSASSSPAACCRRPRRCAPPPSSAGPHAAHRRAVRRQLRAHAARVAAPLPAGLAGRSPRSASTRRSGACGSTTSATAKPGSAPGASTSGSTRSSIRCSVPPGPGPRVTAEILRIPGAIIHRAGSRGPPG